PHRARRRRHEADHAASSDPSAAPRRPRGPRRGGRVRREGRSPAALTFRANEASRARGKPWIYGLPRSGSTIAPPAPVRLLRSFLAGAAATVVDLAVLAFLVSVLGFDPRHANVPALV